MSNKNKQIKQQKNNKVEKEVKKVESENKFMPLSSFKAFTYSLIAPVAASVVFTLLAVFFCSVFLNKDYAVYENAIGNNFLITLIAPISFFLVYFVLAKRENVKAIKCSGITKRVNVWHVLICITIAIVAVLTMAPLSNLIDSALIKGGYKVMEPTLALDGTLLSYFLSIISIAIVTPIAEELLFRGLILQGLSNKYKSGVAIFFSVLYFVLIHGSIQQTFYQIIMGFILTVVFLKTKNVLYSILIHGMSNFVVLSINFNMVKQNIKSTAIGTGAMQYVWPFLIFVLGIAVLALLLYSFIKVKNLKSKKQTNCATESDASNAESLKDCEENGNALEVKENFSFKKLSSNEKTYFVVGLVLSSVLWLGTSIGRFFIK